MIGCLFFDFDGVVVESAAIKTRAFTALYPDASLVQLGKVKQHHLENTGISRYQKFEWIEKNVFGASLSEIRARQLGERFSQLVFDAIVKAPLVPGALDLLVDAQGKIPIYLISGTPQSELDLIVDRMNMRHFFNQIFGSPSIKAEIIRKMLIENSADAEFSCFIGDGPTDYEAALATSVRFIARDSGEHKDYWWKLGLDTVEDLSSLNLNNMLEKSVVLS